ncbi:pentapeptide repeat-containing protein [Flavobacterium crassostreae]|uniref:MCBG-like protein n=1 Tax=Flavobacterium crassostreae TaxID=1763534 RepID=A0A1B9DYR0_9FLAO|nr:pentapeptide repeat-containing protein [Flavobacterium crassostreae]OCB74835.1 hypothetical protein LPBF_09480 [Flavobacterium crassostreae]
MTDYLYHKIYTDTSFKTTDLNQQEFESCQFNSCDFSLCNFIGVTFIDCVFTHCNFEHANINHVAFRGVHFNYCKIIGVNFAMCDALIFEVHFKNSILDFSKFYTLKMKRTPFEQCSMVAVDFMNTDLTEAFFDRCDLYRAEFANATAIKANFRTSYNYTIDPEKTKIKKALFSMDGIKGLLTKHNICVSP